MLLKKLLLAAFLLLGTVSPALAMTAKEFETNLIVNYGYNILRHPDYQYAPQRLAELDSVIAAASAQTGVPEEDIKGILYLESGAHPEKCAGGFNVKTACGIGQFIPGTAVSHGLRVNLKKSQYYSNKIKYLIKRGYDWQSPEVAALCELRRSVDQRFDPIYAIPATAHYLAALRNLLGRLDLAIAAYHMGGGDLARLACLHQKIPYRRSVADIVTNKGLSFPKIFIECAAEGKKCWRFLTSRKDRSMQYFWKVQAAKWLLVIADRDPEEFARLFRERKYSNYAFTFLDSVVYDY